MRPELNDIRLLQLAAMYEDAYERFVVELAARSVQDKDVEAKLAALASPADRHGERIASELARLQARLRPSDRAGIARAALLDIVDVEQAARDFYIRHADKVHDPDVARLFKALAHEEARHVRIAEEALVMADAGEAPPPAEPDDPYAGFRLFDADMEMYEGVSDLGDRAARLRDAGATP